MHTTQDRHLIRGILKDRMQRAQRRRALQGIPSSSRIYKHYIANNGDHIEDYSIRAWESSKTGCICDGGILLSYGCQCGSGICHTCGEKVIINTAIPKGSGIRCEIIIPDTDERLEILNNVREKHEEQTPDPYGDK